MIRNVHERELAGEPAAVGQLLDGLGGERDPLWPSDRWPGRPVVRRTLSRGVRALRWAMSPPASVSAGVAARVAGLGLLGAGAMHALWAAGVTWPARDAVGLARAVVGVSTLPSPGACLAVAGLLGVGAALLELARRGHPLGRVGAVAVGAVLALRGLGGVVVSGVGFANPTAPFRSLDLAVYSPLCLVLAWATWRAISTYPVGHERSHQGA